MESKLVKLKTDFNNIITVRTTVKNIFDILQIRIDKLKILYAEFIKTSKNKMFVFGLDSFNFQSKLIDIEYDDMKRLFLAINNRMYCEYFKLYKIIIEYISVNINDKKITEIVKTNNYPIYKDLEPFKEYKFEIILDIHENILNLLGILISTLNNKENELLLHKNKQSIGLNIDNFITTFNYNIIVMREKIIMFITYIEFFHKLHTKYLKRFANKIQLMYSHINNDIQFDENVEVNKKSLDESEHSNSENEIMLDLVPLNIGRKESNDSTNSNIIPDNNSKTASDVSANSNSTFFDILDVQVQGSSNDTLSDKSKTDSIMSNITNSGTARFKLKNVVKTMNNMLVLSNNKQEQHKDIEEKLSNDDINDMFSTIDMSCDSIINNEKNVDISGSEEKIENIIVTEKYIEPEPEPEHYTIDSNDNHQVSTCSDQIMPPIQNSNELSVSESNLINALAESNQQNEEQNDEQNKKKLYKPNKKKKGIL